jgi:hypothetical protein
MRDDAVAPVIAVMLILAAIVTFLSIWNAVYIPSMKQSAEIVHIQDVESALLHFSSDIERAVSTRQDHLTLSEPVQLGGGDLFFNTLRSSGSLAVMSEQKPIYYLTLYDETGTVLGEMDGKLVNISYEPQGNFWQEQGYRWQYGYLNVTKSRTHQSPLRHYNMTNVNNEFKSPGSLATFAGSFGCVEYTVNQTLHQNITPTPDNRFTFSPHGGNCSRIDLWAVNLSTSPDHPFVSSNGFGTLQLKSTVTSIPYYGVSNITIGSDREPFGNATFRNWNSSFATLTGTCESNIRYNTDYSHDDFSIYTIEQQVNPINVTLNVVNIEIGAY